MINNQNLKATNKFITAICYSQVTDFYDYEAEIDLNNFKVIVINGFYSYFEYEKYLEELFNAFYDENKMYLVEKDNDFNRVRYLKFILNKFKDGEDDLEGTVAYYESPQLEKKHKNFNNYFEEFIIHSIHKQTFKINKEIVKEILQDYPSLKEYQLHRLHMQYKCHLNYLKKAIATIEDDLISEKNNISTSLVQESGTPYEKSDSRYSPVIIKTVLLFKKGKSLSLRHLQQKVKSMMKILSNNGIIAPDTKYIDFKKIFTQEPIKKKILWKDKTSMAYFVNRCIKQEVLDKIEDRYKWKIANHYFADFKEKPFGKIKGVKKPGGNVAEFINASIEKLLKKDIV